MQSVKSALLSLLLVAAYCDMIGGAEAGVLPVAPAQQTTLAPHSAVYEMTLGEVRQGSGMSSLLGYMVFEFSGSSCEGFSLDMSLVNAIANRNGDRAVLDIRSTSWERGDGSKFRFSSSQYQNRQLVDVTKGKASRRPDGGPVAVKLEKPDEAEHKFDGNVLFPTQHSRLLLEAALRGEHLVHAHVYDGSERGDRVLAATAFIGQAMEPGADRALAPVKNAEELQGHRSWNVEVSYFDLKMKGEIAPTYALAFRLYSNGVSRKLVIDYGDYVVHGALRDIKFLQSPPCN